MKKLGDRLEIGHGIRAEDGTRLEPEEQPVKRTLDSTASVDAGAVGKAIEAERGSALALPLAVTVEMTAAEAAEALSQRCGLCEHWRPDEFQRDIPRMDRRDLDRMRADCLDLDPKLALTERQRQVADPLLSVLGKCMALSAVCAPEPIYCHPEATCPANLPDGTPTPLLFKPRAKATEVQIRDRMLRLAQGRKE